MHLVDPQMLNMLGKLRRAKTDLKDAELMLQALVREYLPECYLAPPDVVERRALVRGHKHLTEQRTRVANQVRVTLAQAGFECKFTDLSGKAAGELVPQLIAKMPPAAALVAGEAWHMYGEYTKSLAKIDAQIRCEAKAHPVVRELIAQQPGLGAINAMAVVAEMGEIDRFDQDKKLHSYTGVVPRTYDSDKFHADGHLPSRCNKQLRYWVVAATQCAARAKKPSKTKQVYERVRKLKGPNTAKIAASRTLLTFVFHTWRRIEAEAELAEAA